MKRATALLVSSLLLASSASAAIAPKTASHETPQSISIVGEDIPQIPEQAFNVDDLRAKPYQVALAKNCQDSIWTFSLIEYLTCKISGRRK